MTVRNLDHSLLAFQLELTATEQAISGSAQDWAVREADLERRLARLNQRLAAPSAKEPARQSSIARDAVRLYSSRWCHLARNSVALAK